MQALPLKWTKKEGPPFGSPLLTKQLLVWSSFLLIHFLVLALLVLLRFGRSLVGGWWCYALREQCAHCQ